MDRRERLQFENTIGAPVASEKADDNGTAIEKIRKIDETAAPASQPEQGRRFARLHGLGDETRCGERLYRAPRGIDHVRLGVRLALKTA